VINRARAIVMPRLARCPAPRAAPAPHPSPTRMGGPGPRAGPAGSVKPLVRARARDSGPGVGRTGSGPPAVPAHPRPRVSCRAAAQLSLSPSQLPRPAAAAPPPAAGQGGSESGPPGRAGPRSRLAWVRVGRCRGWAFPRHTCGPLPAGVDRQHGGAAVAVGAPLARLSPRPGDPLVKASHFCIVWNRPVH
jgi:hypothetical protein